MKNFTSIRVPKKYHHMIDLIEQDSDGYWVYTNKKYYAAGMEARGGCHTIHEDTHAEVLAQIRQIEPYAELGDRLREFKKKAQEAYEWRRGQEKAKSEE